MPRGFVRAPSAGTPRAQAWQGDVPAQSWQGDLQVGRGTFREIGIRTQGESGWRMPAGPGPSMRVAAPYPQSPGLGPYQNPPQSVRPYPRSPGPYAPHHSAIPPSGSMGAYPMYRPPWPGSARPYYPRPMSMRQIYSTHDGTEGGEAPQHFPYSDPERLDATQAYLNNPFSNPESQGPEYMPLYSSVRSTKITPGEDFGTMALTKSQRMMMPQPRVASPYRSMQHGYQYQYPMMHGYGMGDHYGRPLTPRRRVVMQRATNTQPQFSDDSGNLFFQQRSYRSTSPGWVKRRPDGGREMLSPLAYPENSNVRRQ